jgi:hypothetical protein
MRWHEVVKFKRETVGKKLRGLVPTLADGGCRVVSATDSHDR